MAFVFKSWHRQRVTAIASATPQLQQAYQDCSAGLKKQFDPGNPESPA